MTNINNFDIFEKYIKNIENNEYINISIITRNKDGDNSCNRYIKTYFITSLDYYNFVKDEIIKICDVLCARAYISIAPKNYNNLTKELNLEIATRLYNNEIGKIHRIIDKCASIVKPKFKYFILDFDYNYVNDNERYNNLLNYLKDIKIYEKKIPTKNGCHIITEPFNVVEFRKLFPDIEIKKNWISLLYLNI